MYAQDATKKDLQELEQRVEKKMEKSQAETKDYIANSDTLEDRFFGMVDILWGIAGLLLGGLIAMIYQATKQQFMLKQEQKYAKFTDQIDRIVETEANTMYLKEAAYIMVVHKVPKPGNGKNVPLVAIEKLIFSEYQKRDYVIFDQLDDWKKTKKFQQIIKDNDDLLVIVMNDDLFIGLQEGYEDDKGNKKKRFTTEGEAIVKPFFDMLAEKKIGFFNVGRTDFRDVKEKGKNYYLGYSNEAYSAYSNINNLLKYMMYAKDIKPTQKRKF